MYNENQKSKDECISWAYSALGLPFNEVKILFYNKTQCELNYPVKDEKQVLLEVNFENTVLTCLFNEENICKAVYLFPDTDSDNYVEIR